MISWGADPQLINSDGWTLGLGNAGYHKGHHCWLHLAVGSHSALGRTHHSSSLQLLLIEGIEPMLTWALLTQPSSSTQSKTCWSILACSATEKLRQASRKNPPPLLTGRSNSRPWMASESSMTWALPSGLECAEGAQHSAYWPRLLFKNRTFSRSAENIFQ